MLNEDTYQKASEVIKNAYFSKKGLSHDDKLLLESVVGRCIYLEQRVENLHKKLNVVNERFDNTVEFYNKKLIK